VDWKRRINNPYSVSIHPFGDDHKVAFLKTPEGIAVGHLLWDTTTGKAKDIRVVSQHRHNGATAMRLLDDAWTHAAETGGAGPTGGNVFTPAAWGAQRTLNPNEESFKEHPWTSQDATSGLGKLMHTPLNQAEYEEEYAKPLLNQIAEQHTTASRVYGARTEPNFERHLAALSASSDEDSFRSRREQATIEAQQRAVPFALREGAAAEALTRDQFLGELPDAAAAANRALLRGETNVATLIPAGACKSCGGRGVDKLTSTIGGSTNYLNEEFTAKVHSDFRDHPEMSFQHPNTGDTVRLPNLRTIRAESPNAVISVGEGHVMVEKPCESCDGTGKG
jgi:hypothetical protein